MYHNKIQFYDKISKLGPKGQMSRSHWYIVWHTNFNANPWAMFLVALQL